MWVMLQLLNAPTPTHTHPCAVEEATVVLEEMDQGWDDWLATPTSSTLVVINVIQ